MKKQLGVFIFDEGDLLMPIRAVRSDPERSPVVAHLLLQPYGGENPNGLRICAVDRNARLTITVASDGAILLGVNRP